MELVTALRRLTQLRIPVAIGAFLAFLIGLSAAGVIGGPFGKDEQRAALATGQVQVDTPKPQAGDYLAREKTIGTQAVLLAERLAGTIATRVIARDAGVPAASLSIRNTRVETPRPYTPLAEQAVDAASGAFRPPNRINISAAIGAPIVTYEASAKDPAVAARLARAVPAALQLVSEQGKPTPESPRLLVKTLAPPKVVEIVDKSSKRRAGMVGAVLFFGGWCWAVIVVDGLLRWRRRPAGGAALA